MRSAYQAQAEPRHIGDQRQCKDKAHDKRQGLFAQRCHIGVCQRGSHKQVHAEGRGYKADGQVGDHNNAQLNAADAETGGAYSSIENCNTNLANFVDLIQPDYNNQGLQIMDCFATDWRLLTSNKEYKSLADLKGSTVRVQENPYHIAFWSALGANPTPLAFGEVYLSLQQGMLDAQENPYGSIIGAKLYEVQKYLYESDHIPFISTTVVSKAKMDSLSASQQQAVYEFCYAMEYYMLENAQAAIDDENKTCVDGGMTYIAEMPADIVAQYPAAAQAAINAMKGAVNEQFLSDYVAAINTVEGTSLTA